VLIKVAEDAYKAIIKHHITQQNNKKAIAVFNELKAMYL
jgi:hypothetical protein